MKALETLDAWFRSVGDWSYLVLFLSAWVEYLVPIFPGDTITLIGGVYAARGESPWFLVLAVTTLGSVLGSACDYWIGDKVGTGADGKRTFFGIPGPSSAQMLRIQEQMRKRGTLLLLCNRFMPGIRPIFFLAAGAAKMPFARVMSLGAVSALAWNAGIIALGMVLGGNLERVAHYVGRYSQVAWVVLALVALFLLIRFLWRRRRSS